MEFVHSNQDMYGYLVLNVCIYYMITSEIHVVSLESSVGGYDPTLGNSP